MQEIKTSGSDDHKWRGMKRFMKLNGSSEFIEMDQNQKWNAVNVFADATKKHVKVIDGVMDAFHFGWGDDSTDKCFIQLNTDKNPKRVEIFPDLWCAAGTADPNPLLYVNSSDKEVQLRVNNWSPTTLQNSSSMIAYLDETNNKLRFKVRYADSSYKYAHLDLTDTPQ